MSPATVGGAETSPPVVNTHFGFRSLTLAGLILCSAGWLQVLLRFCRAMRHGLAGDSGEPLCARCPRTNKRTPINTDASNDRLRFSLNIRLVAPCRNPAYSGTKCGRDAKTRPYDVSICFLLNSITICENRIARGKALCRNPSQEAKCRKCLAKDRDIL